MIKKIFSFNPIEQLAGFSLVEVLVTVFVISVGVLGLLGLQAQGLKNNHSAYLKSQVVSSINDMADRMRANSAGLKNSRYATIDTSTLSADPGKNCISSSCTEQELAAYDIYAWGKGLSKTFSQGYGTVEVERNPTCDDTLPPSCDDTSTPSCDNASNLICTDASTATCADLSTPSCVAGSNHTIEVFWDDDRDGNANASFSVITAL